MSEFEPKTEEQIKEEVIADLKGDQEEIDLEANADLIGRITQRRLKDEEFKASVHSQKVERTKKAEELEKEIAALKGKTSTGNAPLDEAKLEAKFKELREIENLEELNDSPEIKEKIKALAKTNNVSVKKASEDPYIQFLRKQEEDARRTEDASIKKTNKAGARIDLSKKNPDDFDLTKPEDLAQWENLSDEDKVKMIEKGQK